MNKNTIDVSIVAANYNNGRYLSEFIDSILNSSALPKELIIVDDGSTDDSLKVLKQYNNIGFLKLIKFPENRGLADATNAGLDIAVGKYIMRADPDDVLCSDRIEKQFHCLERNKDIDILGSNVIYFNSNSKRHIRKSNFPLSHSAIRDIILKGEHGIQHTTSIIRSEVMKKYKYFKEADAIAAYEIDYEIYARMLNDGHKFANLAEPLMMMRIHVTSLSSNLKYNTIRKTFYYRDKIFKTKTKPLRIYLYYLHMLNYRKYLLSQNFIARLFYLFLGTLFYPKKLLKRLK